MLPPILTDLVGKTFLFKIGIERENYLYKHSTYKVLKIMTNIGWINEFDAIGSPTVSIFKGLLNIEKILCVFFCLTLSVGLSRKVRTHLEGHFPLCLMHLRL